MFKRVLSLLFLPITLFAYSLPGQPSGYVNDFANILTLEQKLSLENKLVQFEKDSSSEIAVAVIKDLGEDTIENYAVKLFEDWKIGKEGKDNGILLLIAMDDRKMRIETGYGLEGALTDIQSNFIINNTLKPAFQQGDFYGGINGAVDNIISATKGEYSPIARENPPDTPTIFFYGFFFMIWLSSVFARSKSWWAGGVVGALIGAAISVAVGFYYAGILALVIFVPFGLILDFFVSRAYQKGVTTGHYPWWIGGGPQSGGGWGGGGGFGGFGGGRSGGGGSSGSW